MWVRRFSYSKLCCEIVFWCERDLKNSLLHSFNQLTLNFFRLFYSMIKSVCTSTKHFPFRDNGRFF